MRHELERPPDGVRRVCLFAQYDPGHRLRSHLLGYVAALVRCGFEVVVACSGRRMPPGTDIEQLRRAGGKLQFRPNRGMDFGAWRDLIRDGHADGAQEVLLANDSVFGPFLDLRPVMAGMRATRSDAWGMVESRQRGWHLQSWFIHMTGNAFGSPAIRRILDQPFEEMSKVEVIERGELALGRAMRAEGMRCRAVSRAAEWPILARAFPSNPMHIDWRWLLASGRVPFIKAELIRENPMAIPWAVGWADEIARRYDYPLDAIHDCLHAYCGADPGTRGSAVAPFKTPTPRLPLGTLIRYMLLTRDRGPALEAIGASLRRSARSGIRRALPQRKTVFRKSRDALTPDRR